MNLSERFLEHRFIFHLGNPSQDVVNSSQNQIQNRLNINWKIHYPSLSPPLLSLFLHRPSRLQEPNRAPLPLAQPAPAGPASLPRQPARHSSLRPARARTAKRPSKIGLAAPLAAALLTLSLPRRPISHPTGPARQPRSPPEPWPRRPLPTLDEGNSQRRRC